MEGLWDATGATVVLVVRDHGPARSDIVEQQIHTFNVQPDLHDLQMSIPAAAG